MVDLALAAQMAARCAIVRITDVAQRTHAFALRARGSWATSDAVAQVPASATFAIVTAGTGVGRTARTVQWIVAVVVHRGAHGERVAETGWRALAIVAARRVDAHRIRAARIFEAFVNVAARDEWVAGETDGTHAFDATADLSTLGAHAALRLGARALRLCAANFIRISQCSRIADALIRHDAVTAMGILTASRLARWHFDCCQRRKCEMRKWRKVKG